MDEEFPERGDTEDAVGLSGDPGLRGDRTFRVAHAMQIEIPDAADVHPLRQRRAPGRQKKDEAEKQKPVVKEALAKYIEICKAHNFPMGFHVVNTDPAKIKEKINEGYTFVAYGTDFLFMGDTAAKGVKKLR